MNHVPILFCLFSFRKSKMVVMLLWQTLPVVLYPRRVFSKEYLSPSTFVDDCYHLENAFHVREISHPCAWPAPGSWMKVPSSCFQNSLAQNTSPCWVNVHEALSWTSVGGFGPLEHMTWKLWKWMILAQPWKWPRISLILLTISLKRLCSKQRFMGSKKSLNWWGGRSSVT